MIGNSHIQEPVQNHLFNLMETDDLCYLAKDMKVPSSGTKKALAARIAGRSKTTNINSIINNNHNNHNNHNYSNNTNSGGSYVFFILVATFASDV